MRLFVVYDRAVVGGVCADQQHARLLANVAVSLENRQAQLLPTRGLVPSAPPLAAISRPRAIRLRLRRRGKARLCRTQA